MTGAHEAGLANELKIPFCMLAIVDNFANGIGSALTVKLNYTYALVTHRKRSWTILR